MKIKRILFSLVSLILLVSMLSSCSFLSFFEEGEGENNGDTSGDEIEYIGPIESGFDSHGFGNGAALADNDLKMAYRIEDNYISEGEDVKITLFYGWDEAKYRECVSDSREIKLDTNFGYHQESFHLDVITVGELKKQAKKVDGVWQFGVSKEYTIPKDLLISNDGVSKWYAIYFDLWDPDETFEYDDPENNPSCTSCNIRLLYRIIDGDIYFHGSKPANSEADSLYIGPIKSGFYANGVDGGGKGTVTESDLKIAFLIEDNSISADEDIKITLFYGMVENKYRDIIPESHIIAIKMSVCYIDSPTKTEIIEEGLTVADVKNQARKENGQWQFGLSKEYTIPKKWLLDGGTVYRIDFTIYDMEEESLDNYYYQLESPFCLPGVISVYCDADADTFYFYPYGRPANWEDHI